MWYLVILLVIPSLGVKSEQVLEHYATLQACQVERDRIGFEMAEAYPDDPTFTIACLYKAPHSRKFKASAVL